MYADKGKMKKFEMQRSTSLIGKSFPNKGKSMNKNLTIKGRQGNHHLERDQHFHRY
jgi:hypothetical protein